MNENEITQNQEVEPVLNETNFTNTQKDIKIVSPTKNEVTVTKGTETMDFKDNTKVAQNNSLIYGISILIAILIIIVIVKKLIMKRPSEVIDKKFTQNDKDFLSLISQLNQVYKKTDDYLNKDKI